MIAQLILTALLLGILLYALTEYRRSPAVGLIAVLAAVGGALFRLGSFARDPPCRIRRHRPRCRPHYLYLDRDQSAPSTQSPPQAARAHGADHRTGEGTCYRERPLASIDIMSPRVARLPWRSVDSSGLSMSRRRYSRTTDHRPCLRAAGISKRAIS